MPFVFDPSSDTSKTGGAIVEEVLRLFLSGQKEELNKLATSVGVSAETLSFQYELGGIKASSQLEIDLETYYVWEIDQAGKLATVQPGMNASRTAIHSSGSLVRVNPKMARAAIFGALNAEIRSLSAPTKGLYCPMGLEFDYSSGIIMYDLEGTTDIINISTVSQEQPGSSQDWYHYNDWRLDRNANSTEFPSGNALFLPSATPGRTVRVAYGQPFATIDSLIDDLYLDGEGEPKAGGVPPSVHDILVYGILLRLGPIREAKRNFTEAQGDARRANEVPPGAVMNSYTELRRLYKSRIDEEATRLTRDFPIVSNR